MVSTDRERAHALGITARSYAKGHPAASRKGWFDITEYGAWCNGSHDDSDAWLRARDAAEVSGGVVYNPGLSLLRRPVVFTPHGSGNGERAVYLRGNGKGISQVIWLPATGNRHAHAITWGDGVNHYWYGGASNITIRSVDAAAQGTLVWFRQVIRTTLCSVDIWEQHAGVGWRVDTDFCQNVGGSDVEIGLCSTGCVLGNASTGFGQVSLQHFRLNQNHVRGITVHMGSGLAWFGGMLQGGEGDIAAELGVSGGASFDIRGVYVETAVPTVWKLGTSPGYAIQSTLSRNTWTARANIGQCYVHAANSSRNLEIGGTDAPYDTVLLRSDNNASGVVTDAPPNADKFDIRSGSWVLEGVADPSEQPVVTRARWR